MGHSYSWHHYDAELLSTIFNTKMWVPGVKEDLAKYLLWNVIFVNFGFSSHLFGWSYQPMSFKNNKFFLHFLKSDVLGNGKVQVILQLFMKQIRGTLSTNPTVTDHSKLNLVNTILSCICTRFKTFVVVSDVCKASRLICGKLHKVVTKISFGVFSHKEIFTPQKIHVPSSIKQKIKPKILNSKWSTLLLSKPADIWYFFKFLSFSQIISFFWHFSVRYGRY